MTETATRPRFEAKGGLGEGGVGEVVAVLDRDIGREVAIKRLRSDVQGPAALARFVDEIRTVGALEHPNIVPIHDVGVDEAGALYFVMRRVQGQTLESIVEKLAAGDPLTHTHWTFERRVHLFRQLLDALAFAHQRGFVHRDIKPANVMVGHFGEVFLMDWGIAKPLEAEDHASHRIDPAPQPARVTATHAGAIVGTPFYMSPEQARGEKVDVRSDIYSLCVLFHELLGLEHYLSGATTLEAVVHGVQHASAPILGLAPNDHQSPPPMDLGWFVRKGLEKDPARRYQTVAEMIDRLDARDEGKIPIQCHVTFTKRVSHEMIGWLDRHPRLFTLGLAVTVLGGAGLGAWRLFGR
ncbi:MAG TPA: serine/threonine-protein kinase [Polyangiaceae bacterium]|nr:serine/threonine-protein kinase [Polyangiaceae bacterium]